MVSLQQTGRVLRSIPVTEAGRCTLTTGDQPIGLVASTMRSVSGRIAQAGSSGIPEALASAWQTVGTGIVEIGSRPSNPVDGSYSLRLPVQAPGQANDNANAAAYAFSPDIGHAASDSMEASVPGRAARTIAIDVGLANAVANFDLAPWTRRLQASVPRPDGMALLRAVQRHGYSKAMRNSAIAGSSERASTSGVQEAAPSLAAARSKTTAAGRSLR